MFSMIPLTVVVFPDAFGPVRMMLLSVLTEFGTATSIGIHGCRRFENAEWLFEKVHGTRLPVLIPSFTKARDSQYAMRLAAHWQALERIAFLTISWNAWY